MDQNNQYGTLSAQKKLLELMTAFNDFCKENGVRYSLAYGSLLGAIRHKGFIPWDDDLDIFIDRENYARLLKALTNNQLITLERDTKETLWVDKVFFKSFVRSNEDSFIPTLDVFLLDNVPNNSICRFTKVFLIYTLQGMMKPHLSLRRGGLVLKMCSIITYLVGRLFPFSLKAKWYRVVSQWGNHQKSLYVANYSAEFADIKRVYPAFLLDSIIEFPFEDISACVTSEYDQCLTIQYGDYMVLPQLKDRVPTHGAANE